MSKDDIFLFILGAILLGAMLITFFFKGNPSKHGVGSIPQQKTESAQDFIPQAC